MHNRFDQFVKQLARKGWSPGGQVETDAEVSPDAHRIDVWFVPHARRARRALSDLGLLGRLAWTACTLEHFHCTPSGEQVADCVARHRFFCRELGRRRPPPPSPVQWIVSAGRPAAALRGFTFRKSRWGRGIYEGPSLTRTRIVVVSELPRTRDTLLVRLMGAGRTLDLAIDDLRALPLDAPERRLALPILVRLRLEIPTDPAKQTESDQEFLMRMRDVERFLRQLEKKGREEGREEGRKEGLEEGFVRAVLAAYKARFGAPPAGLAAVLERSGNQAALEQWLEVVTTRSAEEVAAMVRSERASPAPRRAPSGSRSRSRGRSGTAPRRASAVQR